IFDPYTGRFLQVDMLGFAAGDPNLFRYVGNSPTNFTDPSGMDRLHDEPDGHIAWWVDRGAVAQAPYAWLIGKRTQDPGTVEICVGGQWIRVRRSDLEQFIASRLLGNQWGRDAGQPVIAEQLQLFARPYLAPPPGAAPAAPPWPNPLLSNSSPS